jgi:8-oxo-dGTP diphosphatase
MTTKQFQKLSPEVLREHKGKSFTGITTTFICHDGEGSVFMAKRGQKCRDENGTWDHGAGGLKWGSTAEDNVKREIEEEYAARPTRVDFLGYRDVFREMSGVKTHWLAMDFAAQISRDEAKINEPDTFDDCGWFEWGEWPEPLHSQVLFSFSKYEKQIFEIWKQIS